MKPAEALNATTPSQQRIFSSTFCTNVTPADADLGDVALGLFVTTGGTLALTCLDGSTVTITVPDNYSHNSAVTRVASASTASGIIAYH